MNQVVIKNHMEKVLKSNRVSLDDESLRWTPLVHTNVALIDGDKENEKLTNGVKQADGEGEGEVEVTSENEAGKSHDEKLVNGFGKHGGREWRGGRTDPTAEKTETKYGALRERLVWGDKH